MYPTLTYHNKVPLFGPTFTESVCYALSIEDSLKPKRRLIVIPIGHHHKLMRGSNTQ